MSTLSLTAERPWPHRPLSRALAGAILAMAPIWCEAGIVWDDLWSVMMGGQRLSVEAFTSSLPPDVVARRLANGGDRYARYMVADGRILLSGVASGAHWVAEIAGHPDGAQGYVSALYFDPSRKAAESLMAHVEDVHRNAPLAQPARAGAGRGSIRRYRFDDSVDVEILAGNTPLPSGHEAEQEIDYSGGVVLIPAGAASAGAVALRMPGH